MIEVALMLEGQDGLTWDIWQRIAGIAEDGGFAGLYRSDHFTNPQSAGQEFARVLDLAGLAGQPHLAHRVRADGLADLVPRSGHDGSPGRGDRRSLGRATDLGLGAGWQEREHTNFGYPLLERGPRFKRFQRGL